jgi:hypothetical protein
MSRGGYRKGSGRKPSWNHPDTQLIRIPKLFASQLLQLARQLDQGEYIEEVSDSIDFVTESYDPETLNAIAEEIVANETIARNPQEREAVKKALLAFIKRLI